jgi:hypothetical protein
MFNLSNFRYAINILRRSPGLASALILPFSPWWTPFFCALCPITTRRVW